MASETTPRIPAQRDDDRPASRWGCPPARGSAPDSRRGRKVAGYTQTNRATTTTRKSGDRVPGGVAGPVAAEAAQHDRQLQPDQREDRGLQDEGDHLPDRVLLEPGREVDLPRAVAEVERDDDHGEHPGGVELLGGGVGDERDQQGEGVLQQRLLQVGAQPVQRQPSASGPTATPPTAASRNSPMPPPQEAPSPTAAARATR